MLKIILSIAFIGHILCAVTDLPRWACLFNTLPITLVLTPHKAPCKRKYSRCIDVSWTDCVNIERTSVYIQITNDNLSSAEQAVKQHQRYLDY